METGAQANNSRSPLKRRGRLVRACDLKYRRHDSIQPSSSADPGEEPSSSKPALPSPSLPPHRDIPTYNKRTLQRIRSKSSPPNSPEHRRRRLFRKRSLSPSDPRRRSHSPAQQARYRPPASPAASNNAAASIAGVRKPVVTAPLEELEPRVFRDKLVLASREFCPRLIVQRAERRLGQRAETCWFHPEWDDDLYYWGDKRYLVLESVRWNMEQVWSELEAKKKANNQGIEIGRGWVLFVHDVMGAKLRTGLKKAELKLREQSGELYMLSAFEKKKKREMQHTAFRIAHGIDADVPAGTPLYYSIIMAIRRMREMNV